MMKEYFKGAYLIILLMSIFSFVCSGVESEKKNDKSKHPWAKWGNGSFSKMRMVSSTGLNVETTTTLKKVTDENYTIQIKMGKNKERELTISLAVDCIYYDSEAKKIGDETLVVEKAKYDCSIWEQNYEKDGMHVKRKVWITQGINFPLKAITKTKGEKEYMTMTVEMLAVNLNEELIIGERKLKCIMMKGTQISKFLGKGSIISWMCPDMPGGMAKTVIETDMKGVKFKQTHEITDFLAKK